MPNDVVINGSRANCLAWRWTLRLLRFGHEILPRFLW